MAKGQSHNMSRLDTAMKDKLAKSIKRIEAMVAEIAEVAEDIKAEKKALKDAGFNAKAVGRILSDNALRRRDPEKFDEFSSALDVYMVALGLV